MNAKVVIEDTWESMQEGLYKKKRGGEDYTLSVDKDRNKDNKHY